MRRNQSSVDLRAFCIPKAVEHFQRSPGVCSVSTFSQTAVRALHEPPPAPASDSAAAGSQQDGSVRGTHRRGGGGGHRKRNVSHPVPVLLVWTVRVLATFSSKPPHSRSFSDYASGGSKRGSSIRSEQVVEAGALASMGAGTVVKRQSFLVWDWCSTQLCTFQVCPEPSRGNFGYDEAAERREFWVSAAACSFTSAGLFLWCNGIGT